MKKHIILLCSALLYVSNVQAASETLYIAPPIDLKEALSSAYATNENIKIAQQRFLTESESFPRALSSFLPDVSMSVSSSKSKTTPVGRYAGPPSEAGPDATRSLQVTQNIFNGGESTYSIKIAQTGFLVNKAALYSAEQKTLMEALSAYLGLWGAEQKYNIAITAVEFASQNLKMVTEKKNVGNATITDVAAAEAQLAKANSEKSQNFANLIASRSNFRTVIGIDANNLSFPPVPDDLPENLESFKAMVEKANFDLISAKSILSQSKDSVKLSYAALLPRADLSISTGRNYYDPENNSRVNSRSINTSATLRIPVLTAGGVNHSRVREAKYKSRQAVFGLDYTKKQIFGSVTSSWEILSSMKDAMISAEEVIKVQTLAVEGVKSGYEVGTQTMLDVLAQRDKLDRSKSEIVDVKIQYLKSAYQIKALMGQMTARGLSLNAKYFNPEAEFRNLKHKVVGF